MRVWKLDCDVDNYEFFRWKREFDLNFIQSFDGTEKMKEWRPEPVKRVYDREFSNTPGLLAHIPVFDEKAVELLKDLLIGNAEILPLDYEGGDFYAINVTKVVDCIDYEKSKYETFSDGIRIMEFIKYEFDQTKIEGVDLFKLKDEPLKRPFVSERFRQRVLDSDLTGFIFELVWDSEQE